MELRLDTLRIPTRPIVWLASFLFAVALGFGGGYSFANNAAAHSATIVTPPVATSTPLLDRAAERQSTSREGGPGGQFGDTP